MFKHTIWLLPLIVALVVLSPRAALPAQQIATAYKPVVGQPHPDFVLPAIDDQRRISLADFRGKKLLLFHFASW